MSVSRAYFGTAFRMTVVILATENPLRDVVTRKGTAGWGGSCCFGVGSVSCASEVGALVMASSPIETKKGLCLTLPLIRSSLLTFEQQPPCYLPACHDQPTLPISTDTHIQTHSQPTKQTSHTHWAFPKKAEPIHTHTQGMGSRLGLFSHKPTNTHKQTNHTHKPTNQHTYKRGLRYR